MCWAALPMILQVAGAGLAAYSSIQQGQAQQAASEFNAQIAERNAQAVESEKKNVQDAAAIERRRLGERVRAERGELQAKYAHMGLDPNTGSPADLIGDIQRAYDIDRTILGRNEITELERLDNQQADYRDGAKLSRMEGKSASKGASMNAMSSMLGGVATVSDRWIQPPAANANTPSTVTTPRPKIKVGAG